MSRSYQTFTISLRKDWVVLIVSVVSLSMVKEVVAGEEEVAADAQSRGALK